MKLLERPAFFNKALHVGQEIMKGIDREPPPAFNLSGKGSLHQKGTESVLSGIPGMLLFLLELSQQSDDNSYLRFAQEKIEWIADRAERDSGLNFSLYNGKMGVAHALTRFYQVTGNVGYLDMAMGIARKCPKDYLHYGYASDSLFDGRAGTLLAFLRLHSLTGESWLLEAINLFIGKMLKGMITDPNGLYWSERIGNAKGESGLGYGVGGIGYVFLELGHYFDKEAFYSVAESVFRYEDHYRDSHPDDPSWTTGTIGIGLTRLRGWQLTANARFLQDVFKACDTLTLTLEQRGSSLKVDERVNTGLFFLTVYRVTQKEVYFQQAVDIANELCRDNKPVLQEELAGMAHLFLQLQNPSPSLFLLDSMPANGPGPETDFYPYITLEKEELQKMVLKKDFYRTVYLLEHIDIKYLNDHIRGTLSAGIGRNRFVEYLKNLIPRIDTKYRTVLSDLFHLELTKLAVAERHSNDGLLHTREIARMETAARLLYFDEEHLLQVTVFLNDDVTQVRTTIHPDIDTDCAPAEALFNRKKSTTTLFRPTTHKLGWQEIRKSYDYINSKFYCDRVSEVHLSPIQEKIVSGLTSPRKIQDIVEDADTMAAIRNFLVSGIIKPCP